MEFGVLVDVCRRVQGFRDPLMDLNQRLVKRQDIRGQMQVCETRGGLKLDVDV